MTPPYPAVNILERTRRCTYLSHSLIRSRFDFIVCSFSFCFFKSLQSFYVSKSVVLSDLTSFNCPKRKSPAISQTSLPATSPTLSAPRGTTHHICTNTLSALICGVNITQLTICYNGSTNTPTLRPRKSPFHSSHQHIQCAGLPHSPTTSPISH